VLRRRGPADAEYWSCFQPFRTRRSDDDSMPITFAQVWTYQFFPPRADKELPDIGRGFWMVTECKGIEIVRSRYAWWGDFVNELGEEDWELVQREYMTREVSGSRGEYLPSKTGCALYFNRRS
jgi:hypothetical protein